MRHIFVSLSLVVFLLMPMLTAPAHAQDNPQQAAHQQTEDFWFGHPGNASEVTRTVLITAEKSRFLPGKVNIRTGETVQFEIVNQDKVAHEFVIGDVAEQTAHEKEMAVMPSMPISDVNSVSVPAG
jgi:uncharacterized cupredoxin-like copper-binding protein